MIKNIILFLVIVIICNTAYCKKLPKTYDAPVELSKGDKRRIDQANVKIKAAMDLWDKVSSTYKPENVTNYKIDSIYSKNGLPMLWKISTLFNDGNILKYNVYHKNCADFYIKHKFDQPSGLENAKALQKEAINYLSKAQLNRHSAENFVNEYIKAYDRFFEAFSLEIIAVKKEGRALQIYLDWPIHYPYVFDEDVEQNLFKPQLATVTKKKEDPKPDTTIKIVAPIIEDEALDSTVIYYSVQIAAHTQQMKEQLIRETIYKGNMKILEIHEDGWYKYLLGHFKTQDNAFTLLNQIRVEKAFVVAYRNGKRVKLKDVNQPD